MNDGLEHELLWHPLKQFGFTHPFFTLHAPTIINTWIALIIIAVGVLMARYFLKKQDLEQRGRSHQSEGDEPLFTVHAYGSFVVKAIIKSFMTLVEQSNGIFIYRYFSFTTTLFLFILVCNWVGLIPYAEEPSKNLNTTLALGIIVLLYIQKEIIRVHGIIHYLKEYFLPIDTFFPLNIMIGLVMLPLKVMGELASVISLSFRLFGNIFGGAIIIKIFQQGLSNSLILNSLATLFGVNLLLTAFFVLFEGGLQAFVFAILTLTNISMATALEQENHS